MKNLIYALFVVILFYNQIAAQSASQKLNDFFSASGNPVFFNGNVLVAENGKIIYQKSFGYADIAKKILNAENSTFQTASVSKIFTSTAVLQLKDKGKLKLTDSLVKYFPDFPYPNITIKHLLSHTSGLPDLELYQPIIDRKPDLIITSKDVIPALKLWNKPLKFQPGDKAEYCNTNFVLLALLVEKISQQPFQDYLKKNIFIPAQMNDTFVRVGTADPVNNPAVKNHILSTMYKTIPEDVETVNLKDRIKMRHIKYETYNLGATLGDQNVITTTADLLKFNEALYSSKLLSPATMQEAFTPVVLNSGETYYGEVETAYQSRCSFGLGWIVCEDPKIGKIVGHDGYNRGILTMFYRNITKRQTVIMFDNNEGINFNEKVASVVNILNGKAPLPIDLKNSAAREFGEVLLSKGIEAALVRFNEIRNDAHYVLTERGINFLGYDLLHNDYKAESLEVFKLNVILFPDSFNVYDSYAQALAENNKKTEAITMYKKAIALNPKNEASIKSLQKLQDSK